MTGDPSREDAVDGSGMTAAEQGRALVADLQRGDVVTLAHMLGNVLTPLDHAIQRATMSDRHRDMTDRCMKRLWAIHSAIHDAVNR